MSNLKRINRILTLIVAVVFVNDATAYSAKLSLKTKYLGSIGTTVDDLPVLQPYVEFGDTNGIYGYFWANLPLSNGNPKRSMELEPSIGFRQTTGTISWSVALTLFDLQAPRVLQYRQDVLSPSVKLVKNKLYAELRYYGADRANDGVLVSAGVNGWQYRDLTLSGSLVYVDAPFHFEPIAYAKAVISTDFNACNWTVALELMDILYFANDQDQRSDEFALAISYRF